MIRRQTSPEAARSSGGFPFEWISWRQRDHSDDDEKQRRTNRMSLDSGQERDAFFLADETAEVGCWLNSEDIGTGGLGFYRVNSKDLVIYEDKKKAKIIGNRYLMGSLLGEGSYGKVKEVLDLHTLTRRAVKILAKKKLRKIPNGEQNVKSEMKILSGLSHQNVIKLLDVHRDDEKQKTYMIFEFAVVVMQELLRRAPGNRFPISQAHCYFTQLCRGLEYLHSQGIIHKDIKADNLLLTTDGTVKIADLGVAEQLARFAEDDTCHTSQGSPAVQSPEIANGCDTFHGYKLDIWSSGVTLFNITTGKYPFEGDTIYKLFNAIGNCEVLWPVNIEVQLLSLLKGMLHKDPACRFTLEEVFKHPWMMRKPAITDDWVPIPVTDDDPYRQMSVMSVLDDMHSSIEGSHESVGSADFENRENLENSAEPKLRKNLSQMCRMS